MKAKIKIISLGMVLGLLASLAWAEEKGTETYEMREIIFIPWGEGKEKVGLKEVEYMVQGIATVTTRYGATKLEVDKDGNLYIWDDVAGKGRDFEQVIKKPKSNKILKYVKEKKKGKEIGEYKYAESIPLTLKGLTTKGKPFEVEKGTTSYKYEIYSKLEAGNDVVELKIKDNVGRIYGEIEYGGHKEIEFSDELGFDKEGNIYLRRKGRGLQIVYKVSKEGKLIGKIELFDSYANWTSSGQWETQDYIRLDNEGNIYQLLSKENGVHIYKWELKQ